MQVQILEPKINATRLQQAIAEEYGRLACDLSARFHFVTGWQLADITNYDLLMLMSLPPGAVQRFAGVGNPFAMGYPRRGEHVLDIGSGAGMDAIIAARKVGPTGSVTGVDLTPDMVRVAREHAEAAGLDNIAFRQGSANCLPLEDESVDLIISNGVINLCPDKERVFSEMYRVLKPGGRLQIADVVLNEPVGQRSKELVHLWTNCVAGGMLMLDYRSLLMEAGFKEVRFEEYYNVFGPAPVASAAAKYGAMGWNIRARV
jgi:arsenite methyltransferase